MLQSDFQNALELLSEILQDSGSQPHWLIVCGGAALQAHGIITRATRDLDVIALRQEFSGIESAFPLSSELRTAIAQVADFYNLPKNWLNASSAMILGSISELPPQLWSEPITEEFGSHLKISYLSTSGLTLLKVLAFLQRNVARDYEDLIAISPTERDIKMALDWYRTHHDTSPADKGRINKLLKNLNYEELQ